VRIEQYPIRARAWPGGQDSRANDRPIETAPAYDPLLRILIGVDAPKEQGQGGMVEESSTATAVAGSQARD
jgi:hypothetical protein